MINLIAQIILVLSLGGILFLLINKMPALASLSLEERDKKQDYFIIEKIKKIIKGFSFDTKVKLDKLPKEKQQENKFDKDDDYWERVVE